MKKYITLIIILGITISSAFAQDETENQPVTSPFESGNLIDAQTPVIYDAKTLEFVIQHKFGSVEDGLSNLFGIYSSANVRLGLNYVPIKNLQIGAGITRTGMNTDFSAKWTIFKQTTNNAVPVFVTLYGNMAINGLSDDDLTLGERLNNYQNITDTFSVKFADRFSYFSQLIIGRKFNDNITLQGGISFTHTNLAAQYHDHDRIGLHLAGRAKFSPQSSFIFTYDAPLKIQKISEQNPDWNADNAPGWNGPYYPKPCLRFGVEISTYTHVFQIYVGNAGGILPQIDMMNNMNKPFEGLAFGFTITRLWFF